MELKIATEFKRKNEPVVEATPEVVKEEKEVKEVKEKKSFFKKSKKKEEEKKDDNTTASDAVSGVTN